MVNNCFHVISSDFVGYKYYWFSLFKTWCQVTKNIFRWYFIYGKKLKQTFLKKIPVEKLKISLFYQNYFLLRVLIKICVISYVNWYAVHLDWNSVEFIHLTSLWRLKKNTPLFLNKRIVPIMFLCNFFSATITPTKSSHSIEESFKQNQGARISNHRETLNKLFIFLLTNLFKVHGPNQTNN